MDHQSKAHRPLKGKTAIITGASRGIGAGIAYKLASMGADIMMIYKSPNSETLISKLEEKIRALPHQPIPKTLGVQADLRSLEAPEDIVCAFQAWRGCKREDIKVDILVNNAGVELVKKVGEGITAEDFASVYDVNVRAPLLLTQALLPFIQPGGRVINIGSVGSRAGFPGLSVYCSSKAAIEGLTRCWAAELGHNGTTVNCVNPGPIQSEMLDNIPKEIVEGQKKGTPLQNRLGTVEEVADVVAWLAGDDSKWITGQVISASGGWAMY